MTPDDSEVRQQLLDGLGQAADCLGQALAALGGAYEQLDDQQAERLEEALFRPIQRAYGRARRTHTEFARRYGLPDREFTVPAAGIPSTGVKGFIESAVDAVERAEHELVALQESPLALEVGDVELRAGLTEARVSIGEFSHQARLFLRTFGR